MSTDDVTERSVKCPCEKGTITFITTSPDHAWARASQTNYSATINCEDCHEKYVSHQQSYNDRPVIVHREEVNAKTVAREKYRTADKAISQSEESGRLRPKVIAVIDEQPSMAARHRKLSELGLSYESYGTYAKRPYDGAEAIRRVGGAGLARIGSISTFGGNDQFYFITAAAELQMLSDAESSIRLRPVKLKN